MLVNFSVLPVCSLLRMNSSMEDEKIIPEMSDGSYEADRVRVLIDCKQRHSSYVSLSELAYNSHPFNHERHKELKHHYLPEHYNRRDCFDLVHATWPLVVLVKTGGRCKNNGSGRIVHVGQRSATQADGTVLEETVVEVITACHICKHAQSNVDGGFSMECILDYNRPKGEEKEGTSLKVSGIHSKDESRDVCVLECVISDKAMAKVLTLRVANFQQVFQNVFEKMKRKKMPLDMCSTSDWTMSRLVIVISHPHGGPKKISVGEWTWRVPYNKEKRSQCLAYTYTANTCCGSSGAPVIVFGAPTNDVLLCHKGKRATDGVNCSSQAFRLKMNRRGTFFFQAWENA